MSDERCRPGKHKFQPRYSRRAPAWIDEAIKSAGQFSADTITYEQVYECDVCVRCGMITAEGAG